MCKTRQQAWYSMAVIEPRSILCYFISHINDRLFVRFLMKLFLKVFNFIQYMLMFFKKLLVFFHLSFSYFFQFLSKDKISVHLLKELLDLKYYIFQGQTTSVITMIRALVTKHSQANGFFSKPPVN